MTSHVRKLNDRGLIRPPAFLPMNVQFECMMGSIAYGVSDDSSDIDLYGWCIPPKDVVFPHLKGEIPGFGRQTQRFEQFQQHHISCSEKEYDVSIYSIIKYFQLCMENNPNMLDSLFVPQTCILHITQVGQMVRENRQTFLHKGAWHKFKGYAFSQIHKMKGKNPEAGSKRHELRDKYGYDTKFAYHVVRLMSQIEQILTEGDLDLQEKGRREHMKAIRRGEVAEQDIIEWFNSKEKDLEKLYHSSILPYKPDEPKIKQLLIDCLEHHYGSIEAALTVPDRYQQMIEEIRKIVQ